MVALHAWHYDGETGTRRDVSLIPYETGFDLAQNGAEPVRYLWRDLVARPARGGARVFALARHPGWQIGIEGDIPSDVAARLPAVVRYGGWIDRLGFGPALAATLTLSLMVMAGALSASDWIALRIPASWEQRLGRGMVGELAQRECRGPGGEAALSRLAERLSAPTEKIHIRVVSLPLVNAVALPGGEIVIFDGLLRQADSPDELAGVLAHEIGHIVHRDTSQSLVRQLALRLVLGGMGSDMGSGLNMFMSARHSRDAEAAADSYAIDALRRAHISPADTAALFARLAAANEEESGKPSAMAAFVSSHPVSIDRRQKFSASQDRGLRYTPALDQDAWDSLADICYNDPARRLNAPKPVN
jgi:Zn-dependent protease with chaperone function